LKAEEADIERAIARWKNWSGAVERGALLVPTFAVLELPARERVWSVLR